MSIAIVGIGLAGLAVGWHLLQRGYKITFFDEKGIGEGASGVAAGLMHPYGGLKARRSWDATEGLENTEELLIVSEKALRRPVVIQRGILRIALDDEQRKNLKKGSDVEEIAPDQFLVKSGMTIDTPSYLEGLFLACQEKGAKLVERRVSLSEPVEGYDATVFACGDIFYTSPFAQKFSLKLMKGQILTLKLSQPIYQSRIAKGVLAATFDPHIVYFGATYEKTFEDDKPHLEIAKELLLPKLDILLPKGCDYEIIDCRAGVRLIRQDFYFPYTERLGEKCWWIGALGSRGLLYHAYLGKKMSYDMVRSWEDKDNSYS